jgi:hypothetical protein
MPDLPIQKFQLTVAAEFLSMMEDLVKNQKIFVPFASTKQKLQWIEAVMLFGKDNLVWQEENNPHVFNLVTAGEKGMGRFGEIGQKKIEKKFMFDKVALLEDNKQSTNMYFEKGIGFNI